jgi:alpha-galactosidase
MDMLTVGMGGQSDIEYRSQMGLWALMNSPLILGNDIREIKPSALALLTNPAVLAINQKSRSVISSPKL